MEIFKEELFLTLIYALLESSRAFPTQQEQGLPSLGCAKTICLLPFQHKYNLLLCQNKQHISLITCSLLPACLPSSGGTACLWHSHFGAEAVAAQTLQWIFHSCRTQRQGFALTGAGRHSGPSWQHRNAKYSKSSILCGYIIQGTWSNQCEHCPDIRITHVSIQWSYWTAVTTKFCN